MIGAPGSILWLTSHELRLAWRGLIGGPRGRRRLIIFAILGVIFMLVGLQAGFALRRGGGAGRPRQASGLARCRGVGSGVDRAGRHLSPDPR